MFARPVPSESRPRILVLVALLATVLMLAGCTSAQGDDSTDKTDASAPSATPTKSTATIASNIKDNAPAVDVDRKVRLRVTDGTLSEVQVTGPEGPLSGDFTPDKSRWVSNAALEPGGAYQVRGNAEDENGRSVTYNSAFTVRQLSKDEQTYPSMIPADGATVGVGMPVIIKFDIGVKRRAAFERRLQVVSDPPQVGSFHWISDNEVHYRPQKYWQPRTSITVNANIKGVNAGNGIYGQINRTARFRVGASMVSKVDMRTHQMKVFRNGKLERTIPITTGVQPDHTTRSGVKVIVEKYRRKDMNSETIGIDPESADGYDLSGVEYAMRVTYSGEFIHAAPWSVGSQGRANVSHGCTGLSTSNGEWYYNNSQIGDVVEYAGSDRPMTLTNGYGDWNLPFAEYQKGSALTP